MKGGSFTVSQGFVVALPKSGNAYPIPCADWSNLKTSIEQMDTEPSWFKDVGLVLSGVAITTLVAIQTGTFACDATAKYLPAAWSAVVTCAVIAISCFICAAKTRRLAKARASDLVQQMASIEERFEIN